MATAAVAVVGGRIQDYFCFQCERTVTVTILPAAPPDPLCPVCHGGFLEEYNRPAPAANVIFSSSSSSAAAAAYDVFRSDPDALNPFALIHAYLHSLGANPADFHFVLEDDEDDDGTAVAAAFRLPANIGDYFIGPDLEQLIQHLADNDPNRYGTPPAAKSAVQTLPSVIVSSDLLAADSAQCAVCMDPFKIGSEAKQMPCKHIYHPDCIMPWLDLHNSCPVCRFELPTDDADYEERTRDTRPEPPQSPPPPVLPETSATVASVSSGTGLAVAAAQENVPTGRTVERRFRINLPWQGLFRGFGSRSESSNNGNDGRERSSSGNQQSRPSGDEARQ